MRLQVALDNSSYSTGEQAGGGARWGVSAGCMMVPECTLVLIQTSGWRT